MRKAILSTNLTWKLSPSDPVRIVCVDGLFAGSLNAAMGLSLGGRLSATSTLAVFAGGVSRSKS